MCVHTLMQGLGLAVVIGVKRKKRRMWERMAIA
jgi:hypothetical protein